VTLHDYLTSRRISELDPSITALIMAALRKADTANEAKLRAAWPDLCAEAKYRYWSGGGLLPGEPGYDASYDDNLDVADKAGR